jgi:hypothetical protein
MHSRALAGIVFCLLSVAACSDDSTPAAPTPAPALTVDGTWRTDITVTGQAAQMSWVLTQSGTTASGPVTVSLPNGIVLLNGTLTGTVSSATSTAATLTYTIAVGAGGIPAQPACTGQFGGTMSATATVAPPKMTGDFTLKTSTCTSPLANGTLTLTKQ